MSTKNKCQRKANVNEKQMSTKNKCQPKKNVNQKQMSTKNKCQPKTLNSVHSRLPTKQHVPYTTLLYTETWSFLLLGTHTRYTIHKKTQDTRQGNPISICSVSSKLQCDHVVISKSFLSRNYFKFENEK